MCPGSAATRCVLLRMVAWLIGSQGNRAASSRAAPRKERLALASACNCWSLGMHRSGSSSARGDWKTSTKPQWFLQGHVVIRGRVDDDCPEQRLNLAGPTIRQTPGPQAVPAHASAGDEFFHLGLEDQARALQRNTRSHADSHPSQFTARRARVRLTRLHVCAVWWRPRNSILPSRRHTLAFTTRHFRANHWPNRHRDRRTDHDRIGGNEPQPVSHR